MTGKRKRYAAEFKAKVALEALRGELTTAQLATKHGVHQTMVSDWKPRLMSIPLFTLEDVHPWLHFSAPVQQHGPGVPRARRVHAAEDGG